MNTRSLIAFAASAALLVPTLALAGSDSEHEHHGHFIKDSAITTAVKAQLAAEHLGSLKHIHVDTDKDGVVWLSGSAKTQEAAEQAAEIARKTDGVKHVHSTVKVKKDD